MSIQVGVKQKEIVNKIVEKFPSSDFVVMLFHYDEVVDGWKNLAWSNRAIHVSAINQTKWWFAKRFLHPDIVADTSLLIDQHLCRIPRTTMVFHSYSSLTQLCREEEGRRNIGMQGLW
ncbi:hypothetical protein PIB30_117279 [Stylosanthes scabra]|uniref:Uncharacterized protein n=1 Tax=Stylosanthes scabra TaxID=79078 RepID=A0ABU6TXM1_9FABA|nr:hypothetical protein [Stylosanthes scabra]